MDQKNDAIKEEDMVLIDTWWNVNVIEDINVFKISNVLIDTWWNVNAFRTFYLSHSAKF